MEVRPGLLVGIAVGYWVGVRLGPTGHQRVVRTANRLFTSQPMSEGRRLLAGALAPNPEDDPSRLVTVVTVPGDARVVQLPVVQADASERGQSLSR